VLGTANLVVNNDVTLAKQISTPAAASLAAVGSLSVSGTGAGSTARIAGSIIDGGGTSNVTVATGSLSATKIGTVAAPVDNLTVNNGTLTLSLDAANPSAAVTTLTANGANTIGANVTGPVIPGTYTLMHTAQSPAPARAPSPPPSSPPAWSPHSTPRRSIPSTSSSPASTRPSGPVTSAACPTTSGTSTALRPTTGSSSPPQPRTNYQENLATYSTTDSVLFDDSAMTTNVNVAATVAPASMTFNNATNYTFGGTGAIVGGGPVTKNNTGSVLISNAGANTLGAVAINAGNVTVANAGGTTTGGITVASGASLTVGDNATAGAGNLSAGTIASAGTVNFNRPDASTNATAISGAGTVNYSGSGATTVTGASTYTGVTNITAGVVKPTASNSFGSIASGSGVVNVSAGAAIDVASGTTANGIDYGTNKVFNVVGAGPTGDGVIVHSGVLGTNNQQNAFEKINLTGNATFGGTGRFDTRGTSGTPAVLDLAGNTLTKAGAGQFSVVATNVTDGDIHVTAGTMSLETTSNVAGSGTITMDGGTTLQFFRPTNTISRNMVWNGTTATDASQTNTVNITSPIVMGASNTIQINSSTGFTYSGNITESAAAGITKTGGGTLDLTGANNYSGTTTVSAGTLRVAPAGAAPSSAVVVDAGEYNMSSAAGAGAFKSASITVNNSALAQMQVNGTSTLVTGAVSVAPAAKLDTTDNDIVVNSMAFSDVQNLVLTGFGNNPGGITSSTSDGSQILALFDNTLVGAPDWNGIPIGANATVGKYTYFGDANIDGQVTGDDYGVVDANLNTTPAVGLGWLSGDMNLDGSVTGDDYGVIDANLGLGNGNPLSASSLGSMPAGSLSAVPEPASIGLLAATGLLLGRRRRSSK
jgi:autotransporter-associated beta strand protein